MSVESPDSGIRHDLHIIRDQIEELKSKIIPTYLTRKTKNGDLELFANGHLVWWNEIKNAARYRLLLFIDNLEIDSIEIERKQRYYVFDKLPNNVKYIVKLIAENREGKDIVSCLIDL